MITIGKLLENKGRDVWHIGPDDAVFDAIRLMDEKKIGALLVLHEEKLVGIISERDYARKVILKGRSSRTCKVKEIMTTQVYYANPELKVEECMAIMTRHAIRHLPVIVEGKVSGMISLGDVVKDIISEQKDHIDHLEHYITWEESY